MSLEEIKKQLEMNGQKIISKEEYLQLKNDAEKYKKIVMQGTLPLVEVTNALEIVELTKKTLDECIQYWRNKKSNETTPEQKLIAECYIDAYQSTRKNIFGELKK